ncbi:hypothetical protein ACFL3I_02125 [Pseudomonadota bacterium]
MNERKPLVGFDRYLELAWLDQTAAWVSEGKSPKEVHELIDDFLSPYISGATSKRKTKNTLSGAWVKSDTNTVLFKKQGQDLFRNASRDERLALHYGVLVATYPFFLSLGRILGRLFKLQDEVTTAEFYRRVIETIGDRDSIKRAAARYVQSLNEWGTLRQVGKATFAPTSKVRLTRSELVTWLYASVLYSCDSDRLSVDDITSDPVWFPFDIPHGPFDYLASDLLKVAHQGIGTTLLQLGPKG